METYLIYAAVVIVALVGGWYVRTFWDQRQATIVPRLIDAGLDIVTEINKLQTPNAAAQAATAVATAANAAKFAALKDALSKTTV